MRRIAKPGPASYSRRRVNQGKETPLSRPAEDGFFMPAEWTPHSRCWMEWPCRVETWGDRIEAARDAYAEVATAIARFEPVTMITKPKNVAEVSLRAGSATKFQSPFSEIVRLSPEAGAFAAITPTRKSQIAALSFNQTISYG